MLDDTDRKLLNMVQGGLDLAERPFRRLGERLDMPESEVIARLRKLKESGHIRRIGGIFDSTRLGLKTTLIALEVEEEYFERVAKKTAGFDAVTHCYRREDDLNLWFTLTVSDDAEKEEILRLIRDTAPVKRFYDLPRERRFKLHVFFDVGGENNG